MLVTIREFAAERLAGLHRGGGHPPAPRGDVRRARRGGAAAPARRPRRRPGTTASSGSTTTSAPRSTGSCRPTKASSGCAWSSPCGASGRCAGTSSRRRSGSRRCSRCRRSPVARWACARRRTRPPAASRTGDPTPRRRIGTTQRRSRWRARPAIGSSSPTRSTTPASHRCPGHRPRRNGCGMVSRTCAAPSSCIASWTTRPASRAASGRSRCRSPSSGDLAGAMAYASESLEMSRRRGDLFRAGWAAHMVGLASLTQGKLG